MRKILPLITQFVLATLIALFALMPCLAKGNYKAPAPKPVDGRVLINEINGTARTVKFIHKNNGRIEEFKFIDPSDIVDVKITIDGNPAKLEEVKAGMQVLSYDQFASGVIQTLVLKAEPNKPPTS